MGYKWWAIVSGPIRHGDNMDWYPIIDPSKILKIGGGILSSLEYRIGKRYPLIESPRLISWHSELTDVASESQLINLWTQTLDLPPENPCRVGYSASMSGGRPNVGLLRVDRFSI